MTTDTGQFTLRNFLQFEVIERNVISCSNLWLNILTDPQTGAPYRIENKHLKLRYFELKSISIWKLAICVLEDETNWKHTLLPGLCSTSISDHLGIVAWSSWGETHVALETNNSAAIAALQVSSLGHSLSSAS
jgi:hypothetical protein